MKTTQRVVLFVVMAILVAPCVAAEQSVSSDAPTTYEVMINGESFMIEANRLVKLRSGRTPGTEYSVVLRQAPTQHFRLGKWEFDYDLQTKVDSSGVAQHGTVKLQHELGFTVLVTDLGTAAGPEQASDSLKLAANTMAESLKASGAQKLTIDEPQELNQSRAPSRGVVIRYGDRRGFPHTCLVCVYTSENRLASCVVDFFDRDQENAWPLVRKTIDSIGPVRTAAPGPVTPVPAAASPR